MSLAAIQENSLSAFDKLSNLVSDYLAEVDLLIDQHLHSGVPLIGKIAKHIIYSGGKRLRPSLVILASLRHGQVTPETIALATAVEFIHTATLLHDDVIDESNLRRGELSSHKIWGNTATILVGDFLFARAFELMVKTKNQHVLEILSKTSAIISAGEVRQLVETHNFDISVETSLEIMGAKTAELFGAACQTGALIAKASEQQALELYDYGYALGMIFQITDDVLDYTAQDESRGKIPGDDFREGKITLPIILAYQAGSTLDRNIFQRTLIDLDQKETDFVKVKNLIRHLGGFDKSLKLAQNLSASAQTPLHQNSRFNELLKDLLTECLNRTR